MAAPSHAAGMIALSASGWDAVVSPSPAGVSGSAYRECVVQGGWV